MVAFKTPLRGQQELTLLGSEKTTSLLVVFICFDRFCSMLRIYACLLFYVYHWQSLAERAADLVVDGAGSVGDIVRQNGVDAVSAHDDDFVSDFYVRYGGYVDHALVHADVSRDRADHAVDDDLCL